MDKSGNTIYVIGGLVDRTVKKWVSFDRSLELKVQSLRLPVNEYLDGL